MDYTEAFAQIENFRIYLIEEEKSTLTVQKYIRDITKLFAYQFRYINMHSLFPQLFHCFVDDP